MEFRAFGGTAHAGVGDDVASAHLVAAGDLQVLGIAVDRNEAVVMADEDGVTVLLQAISSIDDDAVFGGLDRRAFR